VIEAMKNQALEAIEDARVWDVPWRNVPRSCDGCRSLRGINGKILHCWAREAGKTQFDTIADCARRFDFLRYLYAKEGEKLPRAKPRGTISCILSM